MSGLTDKQKAFVEEYLACWNATEAARRAGYQGNDNTLSTIGCQNLRKLNIAEKINERLRAKAMSADEILARLADQARGDLGDLLNEEGRIDLLDVKQRGLSHLLKSVSYFRSGRVKVEMYDAQAALIQLGRAHGLFRDRQESWNMEIDWSQLTNEQLERIANGENPAHVLSTSGTSHIGASQASTN